MKRADFGVRAARPRAGRWAFAAVALVAILIAPWSSADEQTGAPGVRFEQRIGKRLPLELALRGTDGTARPLAAYFRERPVVLYFGYTRCPQLCSVVSDATVDVLRHLEPGVGREFDVINVSIDPAETVADAQTAESSAVRLYGRSGAAEGWHYLIGSEPAIRALTDAAGFHFRYDPVSRQYAHASGFLIATPDGTISRYFLGVDFAASDVAAALRRAAAGKTGESVYDLVLLCFRGEGIGGRYGELIWRVLGASVALTVLGLGGGVGWMLWQERRDGPRRRKAS